MKSRLEIGGNSVSFLSELPISQNMSINDVRDIGSTNATYSKTISIPFHAEIDIIFENIFEVNAKRNNFNPNLKTEAKYFVNEVEVFNGAIQLLKINKTFRDNEIRGTYECSLIGDNSGIFLAIAGKYLTDIDFSDLDHTLTISSPFMSDAKFNPPVAGSGYVYPYIDYGVNDYDLGEPVQNIWRFEWLKPAIFEREYLLRIFEGAGYSWPNLATQYPNTFYGTSVIIPCVEAGRLQIDATTKAQASFRAGRTADINYNTSGSYLGSQAQYSPTAVTLPFNDVSTSPYFNSSVPATTGFNTGGNYFLVPIAAYYDISIMASFELTVNPPLTTTIYSGLYTGEVVLERSINGGVSYFPVNSTIFTISVSGTTTDTFAGVAQVTITSDLRSVNDRYRVRLVNQQATIQYLNGSSPITSGATSIDFAFQGGTTGNASFFEGLVNRADLPYGGTVVMNDTIPQNITQLDFLTSIIKEENLFLERIKGSNVYNILPRESFYDTTDILDWTYKLDTNSQLEILPMGELEYKRYTFTKKQDQDYYNKLYFDTYKEVYGTYIKDVDNDFLSGEKRVESVFSPCPVASWNGSSVICPRFWQMDSTNSVKPLKVNIRRLLFTVVTSPYANHSITAGTTSDIFASYPYAGDVLNPYVPAYDNNFGTPKVLFWNYAGATYTTNNRYNERYSKYLTEITDPNSKIVIGKFRLDEFDINNFSFRKVVWLIDSYYYVNKIEDYDPQSDGLCTVELLKLNPAATFSPSTYSIDLYDPVGNTGSSNRTAGNGFSVGSGNINSGTDSFISGAGNVIGAGASNISLINCNGVYVSGMVENFVGIGLNDIEIDSTYSNSVKSANILDGQVKNRVLTVTGNTTVSSDYNTYVIDASGADTTVTLRDTGELLTFVRLDASANAVILNAGSLTINGASTYSMTTQYEKITVLYSGTEYLF